jgi:hypothetical protein
MLCLTFGNYGGIAASHSYFLGHVLFKNRARFIPKSYYRKQPYLALAGTYNWSREFQEQGVPQE